MNARNVSSLVRASVVAAFVLGCLGTVLFGALTWLGAQDQTKGGIDKANAPQAKTKSKMTGPVPPATDSTGLVPLTELGTNTYKGEDGGLYGGGSNEVPAAHLAAVKRELARIEPLDAEGRPSPDGKIVFMAIGISNCCIEFDYFEQLADADPLKSPRVVVVNGASGGLTAVQSPWSVTDEGLKAASVTRLQVQAIWFKHAEAHPFTFGDFPAHARVLAGNIAETLRMCHRRFPNCRVVYLSSRSYGGYATTPLNPEPFAYESAFANRWVIQQQIKGDRQLNFDASAGPVVAPAVVWGPYLWADGVKPRAGDKLVWPREDYRDTDGTHPSGPSMAEIQKARRLTPSKRALSKGGDSGRRKVAALLLDFVHKDPLASGWYLASPGK